jgi:hypothetical protein
MILTLFLQGTPSPVNPLQGTLSPVNPLQGTLSPVNPLAYGIIDLTNHITSRPIT